MSKREVKSFEEFRLMLLSDDTLLQEFQSHPKQFLNETKESDHPLGWDKWIYRIAVFGLTVIILIVIVAVVVMYALSDKGTFEVPDLFVAIGSGAIGAIAGLLTPTATEKKP